MFPKMISDFYSKNVPPPSDPLSRAYEDHRSTRLRSRSPPAHSASYSSSRHQSRSPGPRQASIDHSGSNGSLSRAYNKHRLCQVYNFWCFLPLWQFFVTIQNILSFFRLNNLGGHMKIMIQCTLQQFPHQGNLLRGIDNHSCARAYLAPAIFWTF
jgi:hypothetical protein